MKKSKVTRWEGLLLTAAISLLLTGCGSSAATEMMTESAAADGGIYSKAAAADYAVDDSTYAEANSSAGEQQELPDAVGKKLIKNVNIEVETREFDALIENVTKQVEELGGYVESLSTSNYSADSFRNGNLTVRIPSEKLDVFLQEVAEQSTIPYRNESVEDVTLQYVDLDTHKKSLIAERDRLLELLAQAETVEDLITIEERLAEVRYQIESMEAQLRTIDNQVSYSTVYIGITEAEILTPVEAKGFFGEIGEGFVNNVHRVASGLRSLAIWFIISIPYFLVWAVFVGIVFLIINICRKQSEKNRKKREANRAAQKMNMQQAQGAVQQRAPMQGQQMTQAQGMQPQTTQQKDE